jgi:hypothetical protein
MRDHEEQGSTIRVPEMAAGAVLRRQSWPRAFASELHRRRVPRAALAYLVASFGVMQGLQVLMAAFDLPGWVLTAAVALAFVGFPLNLLLAWFVDIAPPEPRSAGGPPVIGRYPRRWAPERRVVLKKPTWAAIVIMSLAVTALGAWRLWPKPLEPAASTRLTAP